jgi:glucose/mannose-6-phosphate isomerase
VVPAVKTNLDRRASYQHLDPSGMLDMAIGFPDHVEHAARIGEEFGAPAHLRHPKLIVLAGMGGSAVAGDLLSRLIADRTPIPFLVSRDYGLPACVGPDTLLIVSSYSGNTEETLSAAKAARRRKARILCITTGGKIGAFARAGGYPLIEIPKDPPMPPRAALGYSFTPLAVVFGRLGLYPGAGREVREAIPLLHRLSAQLHPDVPARENRAKQLAKALHGKIPLIQGTPGIMSSVAYRWRTQFNENTDMLALSSEYSELNHNEVVGWELPREMGRWFEVVTLLSRDDSWRTRARAALTHQMIRRRAKIHTIEAEGEAPAAQALWAVLFGDFVTIYLAFLYGADPAEIRHIVALKRRLDALKRPRGVARLRG